MDIKELVNILSNNLPANYEGVSFYDFAKNKLEEYVTLLSATDKNEFDNLLEATGDLGLNKNKTQRRFVNLIKVINQTCLKILQLAYKGDMYNAISTLSKLMTVSKATKGYLADRYLSYLKFAADDGRIYYRYLKLDSNIEPKNCNHLPYNLRYLASPNRFNQIGFPCLYVASSLDIAEKESNCKESNCKESEHVYVGEFKSKKKLHYLNFCIPTKEEREKMTAYDTFEYLVTYPLLLLSLITKSNKDCTGFCEEYLFSQLFFHLLFTTKRDDIVYWDGIRYTSTLDRNGYNIVVPASYKQQEPPTGDAISDFIEERFEQIRQYKKAQWVLNNN